MNKFSSEIAKMNFTRTMCASMCMCMCFIIAIQEVDRI